MQSGHIISHKAMKPNQIFKPVLAVVLIFSLATGCAPLSHRTTQSAPSVSTSDQNEIALGRQINESILSRMTVCDLPVVTQYVREVGEQLVPHVDRKSLPYQFVVLKDERIYATSAPGGFVYITTGFLKFLNNESELAAVLAHELGELQYRDPRLSQILKGFEKLVETAGVVAPVFGSIGALTMIGLVSVRAMVGRETSMEKRMDQADRFELDFLTAANFDPQSALDVARKIQNPPANDLMFLYDYRQSRPMTEPRIQKMETYFAALPLEGKRFDVNRPRFLAATEPLRQAGPAVT